MAGERGVPILLPWLLRSDQPKKGRTSIHVHSHPFKQTIARVFAALVVVTAMWQPAAHAATPPADLLQNNDFENPSAALEFEPVSDVEDTVAYTNVDPLDGTGSMKITVNDYGRLSGWHQYGWGSGPNASSVVFSAKLRVDSTTDPDVKLTVCAIAYFIDSQEPSTFCKQYPADQQVVDVRLALDTNNRQLNYLFPQFSLDNSGTVEAKVDDVHYEVFEAQLPPVPDGFELVDRLANNGFDDPAADLGFFPSSSFDGSVARTDTNPIIGDGSLHLTVNSFGRIGDLLLYGFGSGPFAHSVTLTAKLRVESSTVPGRTLNVCAIAYFLDSQEPATTCQQFAVDPNNVADVFVSLDTNGRQLNYIIPQFSMDNSGTISATVDSVHYYVVQPVTP